MQARRRSGCGIVRAMAPALSMVVALLLPSAPSSAPSGPAVISTPPARGVQGPPPEAEADVWIDLADLPDGVTTGDPEFIETDSPDGGVAEATDPDDEMPRLPAVPATPPGRPRRPQSPSPAPPAALARDLDPAVTTFGCLAFSTSTNTAACVEGGSTAVPGGRAVLTLLGQPDDPYELWTVQPAAEGGQTVPGDPLEVEAARARLVSLDARPLGDPRHPRGSRASFSGRRDPGMAGLAGPRGPARREWCPGGAPRGRPLVRGAAGAPVQLDGARWTATSSRLGAFGRPFPPRRLPDRSRAERGRRSFGARGPRRLTSPVPARGLRASLSTRPTVESRAVSRPTRYSLRPKTRGNSRPVRCAYAANAG